MNEREAFLAAICESVDEDTPRLVFSDWLDENGEGAWAEFIRCQVTLTRLPLRDPRRPHLHSRERALLAAHRVEWIGERATAAPVESWVFQRGFPERLNLEEETIGDAGVRRLAGSPHLAGLNSLNLESNELTDDAARCLARSSDLTRLSYLSLYGNGITDAGMLELVFSSHLARLASLDLRHNRLTDAGVLDLVLAPQFSRFTNLELWGNRVGETCVKKLRQAFPRCKITC